MGVPPPCPSGGVSLCSLPGHQLSPQACLEQPPSWPESHKLTLPWQGCVHAPAPLGDNTALQLGFGFRLCSPVGGGVASVFRDQAGQTHGAYVQGAPRQELRKMSPFLTKPKIQPWPLAVPQIHAGEWVPGFRGEWPRTESLWARGVGVGVGAVHRSAARQAHNTTARAHGPKDATLR